MKEFLLIFRRNEVSEESQPSPEQIQAMMKPWQDWIGNIAAQNKLVSSGNRLASEGMVVKPNNVITNGPYVEMKEAIGGYIIVSANSIDEAAELSKDCPILKMNGNVEVRAIVPMD
ncbi:MAG: transcription initiation protein [Bacteroidetes bacterium]|nr:transcription initiation protein [Bacteroidota bacterium]MBK9047601.1 transcription initiation protein [Bacteroidota bacterium]MBL0074010.1 transcription initiation protein [Bacteroidota bacterium]